MIPNMRYKIRNLILSLIVAIMAFSAASAHAACSSPTGVSGQTNFNDDYNMLQYCDDSVWIPMYFNDYWANGVSFDSPDYLSTGAALSGVSDTKQLTGSFWFRSNIVGGPGGQNIMTIGGSSNFRLSFGILGDFRIGARDASTAILLSTTSNTQITDNNWHHIMFSFDLENPAHRFVYLDGVYDLGSLSFVNGYMYVTDPSVIISHTSGNRFYGDIADFWLDFGTYIDLSNAANRAKFRDGRGKPMNLGNNGERPLGKAPDIFLSGATASWETNKGTGGGFTENGTLADAVTDPSGNVYSISSGLVGRWKLDDGTSSGTAADSSGNGNTGTLTGMDSATDWVIGTFGSALDFDGANDHVQVPYNAAFAIGLPLTVSAWVYRSASNDGVVISTNGPNSGGSYAGAQISIDASGVVKLLYGSNTSGAAAGRRDGTGGSVPLNKWTHITGVFRGPADMSLYLNGVSQSLSYSGGAGGIGYDNTGPLYIGTGHPNQGQYFQGMVDDVQIYNRGLSAAEALTLSASCGNPIAPRGTMIYNQDAHVMQFCDGKDWLAMAAAGNGGAGCSNPPGIEGEMDYNQDYNTMQYCEGDTWIAITRLCRTRLCGGTTTEKLVFLVGTGSTGNYGGVAGSDLACNNAAAAANLRGTYKAWVADSDPNSAPAVRFTKATVPYKLVTGVQIADNWTDLTDGTIDNFINTYYTGAIAGAIATVATNVNTNGTQAGATAADTCTDWTSAGGNFKWGRNDYTNSNWTATGTWSGCGSGHWRPYCFEQ